ncbi:MAG: hypothetical protein V2I32_02280, partial [Desulforhopalus sp.]|nr:hypothetical protein [Desulforhopalus sp.]
MKHLFHIAVLIIILTTSAASCAAVPAIVPNDPGWPRVIEAEGRELTIYQPQIDFWTNYKLIHVRYAISVKSSAVSEEIFGVAEVEAETTVDQESRVVTLLNQTRELRFPDTSEAETEVLQKTVDELSPPGSTLTVSLDRVLAYLDPEKQPQQQAVELNLDPPKIFFSSTPAILVLFIGQPQLLPVVKDKKNLMFAVNSNWPVFFDATMSRYYLLNGDNWLSAADAVKGPWTPAQELPKSLMALPPDENWSSVREHLPGKRLSTPLTVFISTEPAELILTQGQPTFTPLTGTELMQVANSESFVFLHSGNQEYYLLTAGRWFRATDLNGPWSAASTDLPADFALIADDTPAAAVKAAVPGTTEAKDALLLASIPTKTMTTMADPPPLQVSYQGPPKFTTIETTTVQYATNSPNAVFLVSGRYYCCTNGVWFESPAATGPWTLCSTVPAAIYTIPPAHPAHNVPYVVVQDVTPTTVVYTQTAGYSGEYVATTGVLMFGAGVVVGAILADDDHYYSPRYPVPYSYGWGARYDYHYGGYYRGGSIAYGPYAGGGSHAAYNPHTGTYSRGAYAYGPAGSASVARAY